MEPTAEFGQAGVSPKPTEAFSLLAGWISVYPRRVDFCRLEGEDVLAQPGEFYGGWISPWVQGPFKGDPEHPELVCGIWSEWAHS